MPSSAPEIKRNTVAAVQIYSKTGLVLFSYLSPPLERGLPLATRKL